MHRSICLQFTSSYVNTYFVVRAYRGTLGILALARFILLRYSIGNIIIQDICLHRIICCHITEIYWGHIPPQLLFKTFMGGQLYQHPPTIGVCVCVCVF